MSYGVYSAQKSSIEWSECFSKSISLLVHLAKKVTEAASRCFDVIANLFCEFFYDCGLSEPKLFWPPLPIGDLGRFSVEGKNISKVKQGSAVDVAFLSSLDDPKKIALPVRLRELLEKFDEMVEEIKRSDDKFNENRFFVDGSQTISYSRARRLILGRYIQIIEDDLPLASGFDLAQLKGMSAFLKGIAFKLRSPELGLEKRKEIFEKLAEAAGHCLPRRHDEAMEVYRSASGLISSMEEIILENVQFVKEALFRAHYSLSTESAATLNYIRKTVGRELGLDCNDVSINDPYIGMNDARALDNRDCKHTTRPEFLRVFNRIYTPENIFRLMKNQMNSSCARNRDFAFEAALFFRNEVCDPKAEYDDQLRVLDSYQDQATYQITDKGILFLLTHFGILNRAGLIDSIKAIAKTAVINGARFPYWKFIFKETSIDR